MPKWLEKYGPYIISTVFLIVLFLIEWSVDINFWNDDRIFDAVDANITIVTVIIGFLGAMLPIVVGLGNSSNFVKHIFFNDKSNLFREYICTILTVGILNLLFSIIMFFRDSIGSGIIYRNLSFVWIYITILFFSVTLRGMYFLLFLLFESYRDGEKEEAIQNYDVLRNKYDSNERD